MTIPNRPSPVPRAAPSNHRTWLLAAVLAGACRSAPPDTDLEATIAAATGIADAVVFRGDGGPLDETPLPADQLPLADAARRALTTDPTLQQALADVRIALADARQARLLPNPILNVQFGYFAGAPWINLLTDIDLVTALLAGRKTDAADHRLRGAAADAVRVALDVVLELESSYADVQASDALVPMLQARLELAQRTLDLTGARARAGDAAESDLNTLAAARIAVQLDLDVALREQRQRRTHLARLIGEPNAGANWRLDPVGPVPSLVADPEQCVDTALARRPEALAARWELAALGDEFAFVRWTALAEGRLGNIVQQQQGDRAWGPSLVAPVPIFDTGAVREQRVELQRARARQQLLDAERRIVEDVRTAIATLAATAASEDRLAAELLPRLQARRRIAEQAYAAGQTDLTPLLLAESDLREAEARGVQLHRETATALFRLRRALGGPEPAATGGGA